jgi:hypothetical protein
MSPSTPSRRIGGMEVYLHAFITSAQDGVVNFTYRPLQLGKGPMYLLLGAGDRVHILEVEYHLDPDNV